MKKSRFETIRWIFWLGICVILTLTGCNTTTLTPFPTPTMTSAIAATTETAPVPTPTTLLLTPVPLKSPTSIPTTRHNPTVIVGPDAPTPVPFLTSPVDTGSTPISCPAPIPSSSIIQQDDDAGWHHYWAATSQVVQVHDLFADDEWLWIAAGQGLIRLNQRSLEYELFSHTNTTPDIVLDKVSTLAVDDRGRLWAGGTHGLVRYTDEEGWKVISTAQGISSFGLDNDGNLWYWIWVNPRHVIAYRLQGQEPPTVGDWEPERGGWPNLDDSNWRFLASSGLGYNKSIKDIDGNTWSWTYVDNALEIYRNDLVRHKILLPSTDTRRGAIVPAIQDGIWIGLTNGLFYSDGQSIRQYRLSGDKAIPNDPQVYSLAFTADQKGWAATSEGLFRFTDEAGGWENVANTAMKTPMEEIYLVAPDQQGGLWAIGGRDLAHFDGQSWQHWPIPDDVFLSANYINAIVEYRSRLWITTRPGATWHFNGETWYRVTPLSFNSLTQYRNERLYGWRGISILTFDGTDWRRLPECAECKYQSPQPAIAVDAANRIWRAYPSGIWRYSTTEGWCEIVPLIANPPISSILVDEHDGLWVANYSGGVLHCEQESCELWGISDRYRYGSSITAMAADAQGRIWVGGYGLLSVYDPAAEQ